MFLSPFLMATILLVHVYWDQAALNDLCASVPVSKLTRSLTGSRWGKHCKDRLELRLRWRFYGQNYTLLHPSVCSHTLVKLSVSGLRTGQKCTVFVLFSFSYGRFFPPVIMFWQAAQASESFLLCWPISFPNWVRHEADGFFMSGIRWNRVELTFNELSSIIWRCRILSAYHKLCLTY